MNSPAAMPEPQAYWNYRIVEVAPGAFELRAVHYNRGREIGMTATAPVFASTNEDGETDEECRSAIVSSLLKALDDAQSRPILRPPSEWG